MVSTQPSGDQRRFIETGEDVVRKNKGLRVAVAVMVVFGAILTTAEPAWALGSFSVKLTASGCTEGDYYGQSARVSIDGIWYIRAITKYTYPICVNNVVGARPIGPSSSGPWAYNNTTVTTYLDVGLTYPAVGAGRHSVNGSYNRST